jgi:hypothetical protein
MSDIEINAHHLPNTGKELKKALIQLLKTGKAELHKAA